MVEAVEDFRRQGAGPVFFHRGSGDLSEVGDPEAVSGTGGQRGLVMIRVAMRDVAGFTDGKNLFMNRNI